MAGCADNSGKPHTEGDAYLQVYIPRTDLRSRTEGTPTVPGTAGENAVSDMTVYLVSGGRVIKIDDIGIQSTSADSYLSELIPVDNGMLDRELQLFLVANPGKTGLGLRDAPDFKELYSTGADTHKLVSPGQMVMSNQTEQDPAPTVRITGENTADNPARARVLLDRLAVKIVPQVSVGFDADFTGSPEESAFFENFTFTVESAGLLNAATEFNLGQQWSDGSGGVPVRLLSPTWYYEPVQQYFDRYYSTIEDYTDTGTPPFVTFNEGNEDGYRLISSPFYCLENNSPFYDYTGSDIAPEDRVETKYKGLTTGVVFRIRAAENGRSSDFYGYEGRYYSDTEPGRQALADAAGLVPEDFNSAPALRGKGVKVYEDGNIYYTYWIRDNNYDLGYAVVRNSSYLLKVNSLTRIGDDIPGGGYGPEEPIDRLERLEIVAVSEDWSLVEVTHDFN